MKLAGAAAAAALLMAGAPALAESAYGCGDLGGRWHLASVEGRDGTFFRILPDLAMSHPLTDDSVAALADLSDVLAANGTRLVYVPLPTRAMALPGALPAEAADLGHDAALAASLYDDLITRLGERGIAAVDARAALVTAPGEPPSFFPTDPRLTATGGERLAAAIGAAIAAADALAGIAPATFETRALGPVELQSDMRAILQRHCLSSLPPVVTEGQSTTRISTTGGGAQASLMGGGAAPRIALLAHADAGDPASHLAGFLAAAAGLDVQDYSVPDASVPGGGAFAAISAYLTSQNFRAARPAVLVWVNPIWESLAGTGDQPMRELIAAAGPDCALNLPIGQGPEAGLLIADLSTLDPVAPGVIMVDTGETAAREMRFDFTGPDGTVRSRWVTRDPGQVATGRFYVPVDGLWPGGPRTVDIRIDGGFGLTARVAACPAPQTGGAN